jgi:hypothetical protein
MSSMIGREYVGNFWLIFLHIPLSTVGYSLFTLAVDSFRLILNI